MTLMGTKFEVGKKYRCTTGIEVECVYAYDDNFYHCMFGKVLRRSRYGGNQIGDYDKFSGEAWSEIVPSVTRSYHVMNTLKGLVIAAGDEAKDSPYFKGTIVVTVDGDKLTAKVV